VRWTYRDGNGDVDTNLTGLDLVLEAAGCSTRACEDGGAVAVLVGVDHVNGLVDGLDVQADENRAEDLLGVALHVWLDVGDDSRADLRTWSVGVFRCRRYNLPSCLWRTSQTQASGHGHLGEW
jgi:hypothetical protein